MKKIISTAQAPAAIGPYSQAVEKDGWVFTSGQIALNPETQEMENTDVEMETHRVMKNLDAVLHAATCDFDSVMKVSIFLTDLNDFDTVNRIYESYFSSTHYPARETLQVARLPKDARVEISLVAKKS